MRGIEVACWGTLGKDPELKTSRGGKPWTSLNVAVPAGKADDGSDVSQWLRVAVFGDAATAICERARKGDRVYVEGTLTLDSWQPPDGEKRWGLSVAAWKCERIGNIGKHREKRDSGDAPGARTPKGKYDGPGARAGYDRLFEDALPF